MARTLKVGAPATDGSDSQQESSECLTERDCDAKVRKSMFRDVLVGVSVIVGGGLAWHFLSKWLDQRERDKKRLETELYGAPLDEYGEPMVAAPQPANPAATSSLPSTASVVGLPEPTANLNL